MVNARAPNLELLPAQRVVESLEVEDEAIDQIVIDPENFPATRTQADLPPSSRAPGTAVRVGRHELLARLEKQVVLRRSDRNHQFRPQLELAERGSLAVKEFVRLVAFLEAPQDVAGIA